MTPDYDALDVTNKIGKDLVISLLLFTSICTNSGNSKHLLWLTSPSQQYWYHLSDLLQSETVV